MVRSKQPSALAWPGVLDLDETWRTTHQPGPVTWLGETLDACMRPKPLPAAMCQHNGESGWLGDGYDLMWRIPEAGCRCGAEPARPPVLLAFLF